VKESVSPGADWKREDSDEVEDAAALRIICGRGDAARNKGRAADRGVGGYADEAMATQRISSNQQPIVHSRMSPSNLGISQLGQDFVDLAPIAIQKFP
jgi:hypothetical protein